jgi:hypothetical protein
VGRSATKIVNAPTVNLSFTQIKLILSQKKKTSQSKYPEGEGRLTGSFDWPKFRIVKE